MNKEIFGIPIDEVVRQCDSSSVMCDKSDLGLIDRENGGLDVCISGGESIISNPESLAFFRKLYTPDVGISGEKPLVLKKTKTIPKTLT